MLTVKAQKNLGSAKSYFRDHLNRGDYHSQDRQTRGLWIGKGASQLGLMGEVEEAQFTRLCDNLNPHTEEPLTVRQKSERRVFYDFVISPPKSISVAALVGQDERITHAHERAVQAAASELEELTMTRIRAGGVMSDRATGNMVAAAFRHETSRSVVATTPEGGSTILPPDPHLHSHLVVFNATFDDQEGRWKALQNSEMLRAQKFVEGVYFHELRRRIEQLGYAIEENDRGSFELAAIPGSVREKFSKRHDQIQQRAEELSSAKGGGNVKDFAEHVARNERTRKTSEISDAILQQAWSDQLSSVERSAVYHAVCSASGAGNIRRPTTTAQTSIDWAMDHIFERRAVVRDHEIWREALSQVQGSSAEVADLKQAFAQRRDIKRLDRNVTTEKVLQEERALIAVAQKGRGQVTPAANQYNAQRPDLSSEQQAAVSNLLMSQDRVNIFVGKAGTGKSRTLKTLTDEFQNRQVPVLIVAPQARQVQDLEKDGLPQPQTVTSFLRKGKMPKGGVVIVDESGQLGTSTMLKLARTVEKQGGQLILCGDSRQHGPVERGDALRSLEIYAGVNTVKLQTIRRQDPQQAKTSEEKAFVTRYRESVLLASEGRVSESFAVAEELGAIKEVSPQEKLNAISSRAVERMLAGESSLVVSQTRFEVGLLNEKLRGELKAAGKIGGKDTLIEVQTIQDLTEAQKRNARSYPPGSKVVPFEKIPRLKVGKAYTVEKADGKGVHVADGDHKRIVPWDRCAKWQVVKVDSLAVAEGDCLQIKMNHRGDCRLVNGEIVRVKSVDRKGAVQLDDGRTIPADFRLFQRGYAVTSYGGQGKTVDHILISDAGEKGASNARQWYVDQSRGRLSFEVFTPDKEDFSDRIQDNGNSLNALDMENPAKPEDQAKNRPFPPPPESQKPQQTIRGWRELTASGNEKNSHQVAATSVEKLEKERAAKVNLNEAQKMADGLRTSKVAKASRLQHDAKEQEKQAIKQEESKELDQTRTTSRTNEPERRLPSPEEKYRDQGRSL